MVPRVLWGTWTAELLHVQAARELSRRRIATASEGNILQTILVHGQAADIDDSAMRDRKKFLQKDVARARQTL